MDTNELREELDAILNPPKVNEGKSDREPRDVRDELMGRMNDIAKRIHRMGFGSDGDRLNNSKDWQQRKADALGRLDQMSKHLDAVEALAKSYRPSARWAFVR